MILYTPKKFLNAMNVRGIKLSWLIEKGISRETFVPRQFKRKSQLSYTYKKGIKKESIEKIASALVQEGIAKTRETVIACFLNDKYSALLGEEYDI